jgi:ECF transporter S component (folate family)
MIKMSRVQQIALAGMMLVLTILGTRLPALFTPSNFGFIRISLGPSMIIFSSILLGPLFGAVIGAGSDLLGSVIFPSTMGGLNINPFITLMYLLLGILPWLLVFLTKKVRHSFNKPWIIYVIMVILWSFVLLFLIFNSSITLYGGKVYNFDVAQKIIIITVSFALMVLMAVALFFINRNFSKKIALYPTIPSPYEIALISLICEVLIMLLLGSLIKAFMYEIDFLFIFFVQAVVLFIDVPLNTLIVSFLLTIYAKVSTSHNNNGN